MLFARWQHHLRFDSGFPCAPLKAMVTKISKWSRIQDSFQITPKIESLVDFAIPDIPRKFEKDPYITFWVILLTHRQTNRKTKSGKNITFLAEVIINIRLTKGRSFASPVSCVYCVTSVATFASVVFQSLRACVGSKLCCTGLRLAKNRVETHCVTSFDRGVWFGRDQSIKQSAI